MRYPVTVELTPIACEDLAQLILDGEPSATIQCWTDSCGTRAAIELDERAVQYLTTLPEGLDWRCVDDALHVDGSVHPLRPNAKI